MNKFKEVKAKLEKIEADMLVMRKSIQLVLAIDSNPDVNPVDTVKLAPKTREQLEAAIRES